MGTTHLLAWAIAAVLLFWAVGAYNRLVRLRAALVAAFTPVEQQFRQRQDLLRELAQALTVPADDGLDGADRPATVDALGAAITQADSAFAHARARPGAAGAITSLRLAEDIVAESRGRLPVAALAEASLADLTTRLTQTDSTLAFARRQFNDAVTHYNDAVQQFPTWVIAGLFSFRAAGTL